KHEQEEMSYAGLQQRSAQFANLMQEQGVKAGDRVVIELAKSLDLLAAIITTLRLGASYVPVDVTIPEERKVFIRKDSQASFVVDEQSRFEADKCASEFEDIAISMSTPAYLIYTSGSTGVPKGVQVSHGPLLRRCLSWQEAFALQAEDRHLQMASPGFDVFTGDWVRALCSGACLVLVDKENLMDPQYLLECIDREKISIAEFVPAVLRHVIQ